MSKVRDALLKLIVEHERLLKRLFKFILTMFCLFTITVRYNYMSVLSTVWIIIPIAAICAFLPVGVIALVSFFFIGMELYSLSVVIFALYIALVVIFFLIGKVFGSKRSIHLFLVPLLYRFHLPFLCSVHEGYFGKNKNLATIVGGSILAFFLRSVRLSAASFKGDEDLEVTLLLVKENLANPILYVFAISVSIIFLCIRIISYMKIKYSWLIAGISGVALEFIFTLSAYLLTGNTSQINYLVIANVAALAMALIYTYLFQDIKVNQAKELEFEDEEYRYRVIAIPKIRTEEENQKIRRITRSKRVLMKEEQALLEAEQSKVTEEEKDTGSEN